MDIRSLESKHREPLASLLQRVDTFTPQEVTVALELIDLALQPNNPDYRVLVALLDERVVGYVCFGPTPMCEGTFDLYWIASDPQVRGKGIGKQLALEMERRLRADGGRLVRVETSSTEAYGSTRGFYAAVNYAEEARVRDFYKPGDDLVILTKRL